MLNLLVHQEPVGSKKLNSDMLQLSSQPLLVSHSEKLTLECLHTTIVLPTVLYGQGTSNNVA
jgi:hypothetical protein